MSQNVLNVKQKLVTDYLADELENVEIFSLQCDKEFLENSKLDKEHKILIGEDLLTEWVQGAIPIWENKLLNQVKM